MCNANSNNLCTARMVAAKVHSRFALSQLQRISGFLNDNAFQVSTCIFDKCLLASVPYSVGQWRTACLPRQAPKVTHIHTHTPYGLI